MTRRPTRTGRPGEPRSSRRSPPPSPPSTAPRRSMGREMADAEGIRVETLIIDDDVSVKDSTYTVGRRGVAGNFFVIKAVGAAAEEGAELDDLGRPGQAGQRRDPDHGHGPHRLHPAGQGLAPVRAGRRRDGDGRRHPRRARPPPREAGQRQRDHRRAAGGGGHRPALSGGRRGGADDQRPGRHPISELYILYGRAHAQLADRGITVRKNYVGEYCTSLDMASASLTWSSSTTSWSGCSRPRRRSPSASSSGRRPGRS